tara:strand:- start:59 stop:901 length:843 start_codon:yes stop_codon:yes gene_type:complete
MKRLLLLCFLTTLVNLSFAQSTSFDLDKKITFNYSVETETYFIDDLIITTNDSQSSKCVSGGIHTIVITGAIGPDSTFAAEKLLGQRKPCASANGEIIRPIRVNLESAGGYLKDGYKLGRLLRAKGITAVIEGDKLCASSCAVAFLGGKERLVGSKGSILFHAPYRELMEAEGRSKISCDLPEEKLKELNKYYQDMTDIDVGDRLFDRTMWYCSSEHGWTIKGGAAAELYGIATHIKGASPRDYTWPIDPKWPRIYCLETDSKELKAYETDQCPEGTTAE